MVLHEALPGTHDLFDSASEEFELWEGHLQVGTVWEDRALSPQRAMVLLRQYSSCVVTCTTRFG